MSVRVDVHEIFNFALKKAGFKQRIKHRLLRDEFVADRIANRLGQLRAVSRNHSLRPDGDAEKFYRLVRMKQHPDRQPRRAIAVNGGDDDNREADQEFESKWTQG